MLSEEKNDLKIDTIIPEEKEIPEVNSDEFFCKTCRILNCTSDDPDHVKLNTKDIITNYKANPNSMIYFSLLKKYLNKLNNVNHNKIDEKIDNFKLESINLVSKKFQIFLQNIEKKMQTLKDKIDYKFQKLESNYLEADARVQTNTIEVINNISVEEIISYFEKSNKSQKDLENMINLVKKNSDQEKLMKNLNDMETIIYSKMISQGQAFDFLDTKHDDFNNLVTEKFTDLSKNIEFEIESPSIYKTNPSQFQFHIKPNQVTFKKDISDKLQKSYTIDSVFCAFNTIDGKGYVAWGCPTFTVEIYDLKQEKVVKSLPGFTHHIYICRHFYDDNAKKDYLLATSYSKNCKIWDCSNFTNILTIQNCHTGSYLYSGLIVFDSLFTESPLVVTVAPNENIKIWDFKGALVNSINAISDYTYFLNIWYDNRNNKNDIYIINANSKDVKIYNYRTGEVYRNFHGKDQSYAWHMSAFVSSIDKVPYLFESDGNGNLRVWNIDSQVLYKKILITGCNLRGICLWNETYVLAAGTDKTVKIINFMKEELEGTIEGHNNILCTIEKIIHPLYGESIITGAIDGKIKLYSGNN